jgi:hypothetical protein
MRRHARADALASNEQRGSAARNPSFLDGTYRWRITRAVALTDDSVSLPSVQARSEDW